MSACAGGSDRALVVRVSGPTATLCHGGRLHEARLAPRVPGGPPVAGDRVEVRREGDDIAVVGVDDRRTSLLRGDGHERRPRALAANAELLVVVAAVTEPPVRPRLVDRYLVAAATGGMDAALVITKTDLAHDAVALADLVGVYRTIGHPVLTGSATDPGLARRVGELIAGRLAVLAGHSGVGKSTLASALTGVERATGTVSGIGTGRHTTTDPRLLPIPGGGAVIDTAGVRTFHLPRMDRAWLQAGFAEIDAAAGGCRFRGCAHDADAGCAVEGAVSPARLESYRRLLHEVA